MLGLYTTEAYEAGELGFEPRQYESESQVLPLHHSPSVLSGRELVRSTALLIYHSSKEMSTPFFTFFQIFLRNVLRSKNGGEKYDLDRTAA